MRYDVGIIGNGIAAKCLKWQLKNQCSEKSIIEWSDPQLVPPCSHRSTGVVASAGVRKGVSQLGDYLVEAFSLFEQFVNKEYPLGVTRANHYYFSLPDKSSNDYPLKNRFRKDLEELCVEEMASKKVSFFGLRESSYIINPNIFLPWFEQFVWSPQLTKKNAFIQEIKKEKKGIVLRDQRGGEFVVEQLFLACGAYINGLTPYFNKHDNIDNSKVVPGNYLIFDNCHLGNGSFVITVGDRNLIYRKEDRRVLIGGTTNKNGVHLFQSGRLKKDHELFQELLKGSLPEVSLARRETGLRIKGRKRLPFWGEVDNGIFAINGLYKNGWSLSFLAAQELREKSMVAGGRFELPTFGL